MATHEPLTKETETTAGETPADQPRLLSMRQAAEYLGCSFWTAREYVIQGLIPSVDMPSLAPRPRNRRRKTLRRVLIDRADLDAFVASRPRRRQGRLTERYVPAETEHLAEARRKWQTRKRDMVEGIPGEHQQHAAEVDS